MKVRVSMPGACMTMDLEDEAALPAFHKMTELLCSYGAKMARKERLPVAAAEPVLKKTESYPVPVGPEEPEIPDDDQKPEKVIAGKAVKIQPAVHKKQEEPAPPKSRETYSGFLYVKCPDCGYSRGFFTKIRTDEYRCGCGAVTELRDLVPLYVNCECGRNIRYMTNMTEDAFDIDCLCGAPVAVQWNEKKRQYETIR